jgi:hypothetical protein
MAEVTYKGIRSPLNIELYPDVMTADFTLESNQVDSCICVMTSDACDVTLPDNDTLKVDIGLEIHIVQIGSGSINLLLASGVTVIDPFSVASPKFIRLKKSALNEWLIVQSQ